jgi:hypothetical protein
MAGSNGTFSALRMKILQFFFKWLGFFVGLAASSLVGLALAGPLGFPFELFMSWPYLVGAIGIAGAVVTGLSGWPKFATLIFAGSVGVLAIAFASPGDISRAKAPPLSAGSDRLIWGNSLGQKASITQLMTRAQSYGGQETILAVGEVPRLGQWQSLTTRQSLAVARSGGLGVEGCGRQPTPYRNMGDYGGNARHRTFALRIDCPNFTLFAVHLTNPVWQRGLRFERRQQEFAALARAVAAEKGPVVVIGDFNTAPNAPAVSRFISQAQVNKISCGGRWLPTWRPLSWRERFHPANPLTGIPIDHLYTRNVDVLSCTIGPDFGSDHLPLVVELKRPTPR